ncbi:hypothetical protein NQZ68_033193, partial [Dissostichus eleginoides]
MGGRHFRSYDGQSFDFNIGSCRYILSQVCEDEESDLTVIIQQEQLHLRVHGVNVSLEMAQLGKVKIGRFHGVRDALSSATALLLQTCAVSRPHAPRERAAPFLIPGAVQRK